MLQLDIPAISAVGLCWGGLLAFYHHHHHQMTSSITERISISTMEREELSNKKVADLRKPLLELQIHHNENNSLFNIVLNIFIQLGLCNSNNPV